MPNVTLHNDAKELVRKLADRHAIDLMVQAKLYADRRGDSEALRSDVERASDSIFEERTRNWRKEFAKIAGGIIFGTGLAGIVSGFLVSNTVAIVGSAAMAIVGLPIAIWAAQKRTW